MSHRGRTLRDADAQFVERALPAFVAEARERIDQLEQLVLAIDGRPGDGEALAAMFRCAHTIKGTAGVFGLERVAAFTHHVESLLAALRDGSTAFGTEVGTLLLQCGDEIRRLVDRTAQADEDSEEARARQAALVARLRSLAVPPDPPGAADAGPAAAPGPARSWHVSVRFGAATFRNGLDPLAILSYLGGLGTVEAIACVTERVPLLEELDPGNCHLGFELVVRTTAPGAAIEEAFAFAREDCELRVLSPDALVGHATRLLEDLEHLPRLGDMLVSVGVLTRARLEACLRAQGRAGDGARPRLGELLQREAGVDPQIIAAALRRQDEQRRAAAEAARSLRVPLARLDALVELAARLERHPALRPRARAAGAPTGPGELAHRLHAGLRELRRVPVGEVLQRFRRLVRDAAAHSGRAIALEVEGGTVPIDKAVADALADPVAHLVRNALDHGLEAPEVRVAAGKPACGAITLAARPAGARVIVAVADDGRGIDRIKLRSRASASGLLAGAAAGASPDDELMLAFAPGLSTVDAVTATSGRGVGLDAVRCAIEAIGGTVRITSAPGQGTTVELDLPAAAPPAASPSGRLPRRRWTAYSRLRR